MLIKSHPKKVYDSMRMIEGLARLLSWILVHLEVKVAVLDGNLINLSSQIIEIIEMRYHFRSMKMSAISILLHITELINKEKRKRIVSTTNKPSNQEVNEC